MQGKIISFGKSFGIRMSGTDGTIRPATTALQQVRAYWEALRVGDAPPLREAIDPRGIAGALEQVFMIERIAPGLARFRLVGSQITDMIGSEVRGMPVSILFDPIARDKFAPVLEQVFTGPAIAHLELEAERGIGRPALGARLMLLPLMSRPGQVDLALGCLALDAPAGRAPRRFAIARMHVERLVMSAPAPQSVATALAEPAADFGLPPPPRTSGHLRLVHSAK